MPAKDKFSDSPRLSLITNAHVDAARNDCAAIYANEEELWDSTTWHLAINQKGDKTFNIGGCEYHLAYYRSIAITKSPGIIFCYFYDELFDSLAICHIEYIPYDESLEYTPPAYVFE